MMNGALKLEFFKTSSCHAIPITKQRLSRIKKLNINATYTRQNLSSTEIGNPIPSSLPRHVAIIMDGNARWARQQNKPGFMSGHIAGVDSLRKIVRCCCKLGDIKALTVFALSTENCHRSPQELSFLLSLFERILKEEIEELFSAGVRLQFIGDHSSLPSSLTDQLRKAESITQENKHLNLIVALNYGGRHDLTMAVKKIAHKIKNHEIDIENVTEELISSSLSLGECLAEPEWRHPDLLIRTSGEERLSNFLLWESAYSELYFSDVFWPDFSEEHFLEALEVYARRERRYGRRKDAGSEC